MSTVSIHAGAPTAAEQAARGNWQANVEALRRTQSMLAARLAEIPLPPVVWTFARDGALTARDPRGTWWDGCSVPRRAAREMLRGLSQPATTGCFILPANAWQLHAALSMLRPQQAIVAIVPDAARLKIMLHCCDLSAEITSHRMWFAAGSRWCEMLAAIFSDNPGLPTPHQFIRTVLTGDEQSMPIMQAAERVFAGESARRAQVVAEAQSAAPAARPVLRLCVVGPSRFRVWEDAVETLARTIEGAGNMEYLRVDSDDPAQVAAAWLAHASANSSAVLLANAFRCDLPPAISPHVPVITWVTTPRVAPHNPAAPRDALLLADGQWRALARNAGWPDRAVDVAGWPPGPAIGKPAAAHLAIVADTQGVLPPPESFELSSHRLLWEAIAHELLANPFALGRDIQAYLAAHMARMGIDRTGFDFRRFIDGLIVPAFQQGVAHVLLSSGIPLKVHGCGWDGACDVRPFWSGPVVDRRGLLAAVAEAAGLVHVWPIPGVHPMDAMPRPVVRTVGRSRGALIEEARRISAGRAGSKQPGGPVLSPRCLAETVGRSLSIV